MHACKYTFTYVNIHMYVNNFGHPEITAKENSIN